MVDRRAPPSELDELDVVRGDKCTFRLVDLVIYALLSVTAVEDNFKSCCSAKNKEKMSDNGDTHR